LDKQYDKEDYIKGDGFVEVDDYKIGRRKYKYGIVLLRDIWIFGIIVREQSINYRLEICPDNKRDATILLKLIKKHVVPGTEIHSDCWKGYENLELY